MIAFRALLLAAVAMASPTAVWAQTAPPVTPPVTPPTPPSPPADPPEEDEEEDSDEAEESAVEEVTVTASRSVPRTSIDSISYSTADDLQAANGSLAEALRNIPSVDVDPDGGVSLRGEGVTILVDGRPSALFSGAGRGPAILQTPASRFARIEVMTNPSAAYRPDGSGGVINLISQPNAPRPGDSYSGSVRVNLGTGDRYNVGLNGALTRDRLTLSGDLGLRHDQRESVFSSVRERLDPDSGVFLESRQISRSDSPSDSAYVRLGAEYNFDEEWQLNADLNSFRYDSASASVTTSEDDNAAGEPARVEGRRGGGSSPGTYSSASLRLLRQLGDDHDWTNSIRYDLNQFDSLFDNQTDYILPAAPSLFEAYASTGETRTLNLSSAYRRPLGDDQKLRLGYEADISEFESDDTQRQGPSPDALVLDPTRSNRFRVRETVQAAYGTWERPLWEGLTAQFGLRAEYVMREIDQLTTGQSIDNDYLRVYPTLHVEYALSEGQALRGSYSRRVERPGPERLNPFIRRSSDPRNVSSGNPDLLPQSTDSYELGWTRRQGQTFYQATAYYRRVSDAFSNVFIDLGEGVLLNQPRNLGSSRSYGVELVANGRLLPTLRYNASVNLYNRAIDVSNLAIGRDREAATLSGRANLNWQATPDDFVQVRGNYTGETLTPQGTIGARGSLDFGYRRKLTDDWSLSFTVRDVLDSARSTSTFETPTLRGRVESESSGRSAFIGFTWTFGQQTNRTPDNFDFSGGGAPTGP